MAGIAMEVEGPASPYGERRDVTDPTFEVEEDDIFGFHGSNRIGKTTTIRQLTGLIKPASGNARVFGLDRWRVSSSGTARDRGEPGGDP